ncbi:Crp/Fnr family transcriptional regulator [Parasphingorhabdus sp. DH2-15]|uniref:Crp/Fnr family transcriptional regulator n=1 Tax=Parasphingorhabdus sp. DH2-15 TaxID=3444112 RepID=UPI003F68320E
MHASQLQERLSQHSLFADCSDDVLADILMRGNCCNFTRDDIIIRQGDTGDALYIILSGLVRISMVASNGHEIILDYAENGQVIGEIAFFDHGERTASAEAMSDVTALSLSQSAFHTIMETHRDLGLQLIKAMARRLRLTNTIVESDRAFTSGPRLARYLLRLMLADGDDTGRLKLKLSQSELGNFVGLSREQINRQLSSWSDNSIIRMDAGYLHIVDKQLLFEISEAAG